MFFSSYFVECIDEAGGEDGEHHAGDQLQDKAVQPHVQGEDGLVDDLKEKYMNFLIPAMHTQLSNKILHLKNMLPEACTALHKIHPSSSPA
jgi:hypothetical protein